MVALNPSYAAVISEQLALFEDDHRDFMGMEGFGLPKRPAMLKQLKSIQRNSGWYRHRNSIVWVVGMAPDGQWIALKDQGDGRPFRQLLLSAEEAEAVKGVPAPNGWERFKKRLIGTLRQFGRPVTPPTPGSFHGRR